MILSPYLYAQIITSKLSERERERERDALCFCKIIFDEAANGETESFVRADTPVHAVDCPWR